MQKKLSIFYFCSIIYIISLLKGIKKLNYIGSKRGLLDFIDLAVSHCDVKKNNIVFCDLFSGTGNVAKHYKKKGYQVIANDLEDFSFSLINHYIGNSNSIKVSKYLDKLNQLSGIDTGFIFNNYCPSGKYSAFTKKDNTVVHRRYFNDQNGKIIDEARSLIDQWLHSNEIDQNTYSFLLAIILESADKVANTTSVYGAFLKDYKKGADKPIRFSIIDNIISDNRNSVYKEDSNTLIKKISGDILYLDPPYNNRQYGANYHLLNTISKNDSPNIRGVTGMRDSNTSLWCKKSEVEKVFKDLIENANFDYILLSYNNEGLMSHETIKIIMEEYGEYSVIEKDYSRFKADKEHEKRKYKAKSVIEYIHILKKNR